MVWDATTTTTTSVCPTLDDKSVDDTIINIDAIFASYFIQLSYFEMLFFQFILYAMYIDIISIVLSLLE